MNLYSIGAFENFELDIYPTHVSPIIIEITDEGYRRWSYTIENPYQISPLKPMGSFRQSVDELFPVAVHTIHAPTPITQTTQVIALSKKQFLYGTNRYALSVKLTFASFNKLYNQHYRARYIKTLLNTFS